MSRGFSLVADSVVTRSLKMTRATNVMVAALVAAVAGNVMVAIQFLGLLGQTVLLGLVFVSLAAAISAVCMDIFARSSQTVSNLRSIGATFGGLSGAVLGVVLAWGLLGAALGAGLGVVFGIGLSGSGTSLSLLVEVVSVIAACAGAMGAGVYVGVKFAWRS